MSDWYEDVSVSAERAILTKDIEFTQVKDINAEFLIPIFTPTQDNSSGDSNNTKMRAPSTKSQKGTKLTTDNYVSSNNISATIPKYIVQQFFDTFMLKNYIPKGTEFIISGIGESSDPDQIRITGFYKIGED